MLFLFNRYRRRQAHCRVTAMQHGKFNDDGFIVHG
jgi:hypothetical protein